MTHLKVAVRIRPLSQREINSQSGSVVEVHDQNVISVTNLKVPEQNAGDSRERIRRFTFDYCFHPDSTQNEVFEAVGKEIEEAIKKRYHSCVLAYGQSSSGKTHTMMGNSEDPGLTPKLCQNIFTYLQDYSDETESTKIHSMISYLEIYNEKVRDLLVSSDGASFNTKSRSLRIREHPKKGPYVQGLTQRTAHDPETLLYWLKTGNANRRVAATLTNPHSSRSHSVFTLTCGEGVQVHLVDLAGSERAGNRFHSVSTLKEGANINKSLVALGNVISTLAEQSSKYSRNPRKRFVPYRDSVLTWLLKDALGGNSRTVMIATVSPSSTCYNETVNTLRFGQRAKKIVSHPVVNEDPKERTIRELRAEIARLKQLLAQHQDPGLSPTNNHDLSQKSTVQESLISFNDFSASDKEKLPKLISGDCAVVPSVFIANHKESEQLCMKPEKLLPVMDVTSAVEAKKKQVPKIRRTFSVENTKMSAKSTRPFGSEEAISSTVKEKPKRLSQPTLLRKRSLDKSTPSVRSLLLKKAQDGAGKKSETGVITEESGPQKLELTKKPQKPRAQIVAAVTSRLYGKTKKKEVGTETEEFKPTKEEVPKELSICSNARMKLRELTQQALKANRRKTIDTQTDLFPVLRVKEISTDSDDLKIALAEVKDAETCTLKAETKDAGVVCFLESFDDHFQGLKNTFMITRSCGTQSTENLFVETQKPRDQQQPQPQPQSSSISFTKYLQNNTEPTFQIVNPCTANPIYTSSVNINVSHNYINRTRLADTVSDDSLEEQDQPNNVCFSTPDIISNHNSLEHGNTNPSPDAQRILEERQARCDAPIEAFMTNENFVETELPKLCVANFSVTAKCQERLESINIPTVCAPEICIAKQQPERCVPFWKTTPRSEFLQPVLTESESKSFPIVYEPIVLKSIMKYQECYREESEKLIIKHDKHEDERISTKQPEEKQQEGFFSELPDSLTLHDTNNKKVHFSPTKNERMFEAMSKFMEEATTLMTNLTRAASKLHMEQSYDLEVTVNGISDLSNVSRPSQSQDFAVQTCTLEEASSQTSPKPTLHACSNTDSTFQLPLNKYEALVKESCDRLEHCINKVKEQPSSCRRITEENLHRFPQPFSANSVWNTVDDSSLDSNPTFSDYGSLPRRRPKKSSNCSPSAYLRQLTTMRRQIVESSRDDLLGEAKINF